MPWVSMCTVWLSHPKWLSKESIKFCIKLGHSSTETIQMFQKALAMGNWWLAASSWQYTKSCIMSHAEFFGKTSNHLGDWAPLQPRFSDLWLLAFPTNKITFEREEVSDHWWDSGKYNRAVDDNLWNCMRSQGAKFQRGLGFHYPVYNVSYIFYLLQ